MSNHLSNLLNLTSETCFERHLRNAYIRAYTKNLEFNLEMLPFEGRNKLKTRLFMYEVWIPQRFW